MAIILKANKVNLFVSSVLFVFCYNSPNVLDTPHRKAFDQVATARSRPNETSEATKETEPLIAY
jgi:hypothetical protein